VRQGIETTHVTNEFGFWFNSGNPKPFTAATLYSARYTNRLAFGSKDYALDGDYYLRLTTNLSDKPSSEGYLLTVVVSGDVEPGPIYQVGEVATTTSASSEAETVGASGSDSTTAGATSAATTTSAGSTDTASNDQSQSSKTWIYLAIGLVILVAAATAVIVLRRARSVNVPPPHS